jgi:lon-related putative ATP-dependent protease
MFTATAQRLMEPLREKHASEKIRKYLKDMLEDMVENIDTFRTGGQQQIPGLPPGMTMVVGDPFMAYQVNLMVDNAEQDSPPVIREGYPTYRNLFGSIERVVDRTGVWRTDYSKIKVGSFLKANGGYLVLNLMDAIVEPGVWPALKRALKTERMEIQTFDPFYMFTGSSLKPEPIHVEVKVVVVADTYLYHLLRQYDPDVQKIFRVRADFDRSMNKDEEAVMAMARFVRKETQEEKLRPFDASGVAALVEEAVRLAGRQEKISTRFPTIAEIIREADYWAGQEQAEVVSEHHVQRAMDSRKFRDNLIEDKIQEMIDRDSIMISTTGSLVGQVNGLSVYSLGDFAFGRPARITANTALGREGIINIEREAQMSGPIHNKGVYILSGYLRRVFAQNKPLSVSASIAFEQSYSGVEGDSASSTEMYAILSSLSGVPLRQDIAVTGSVNQKGEVQPIGGVNEKVEGFYDVCKSKGLTGEQGVMIPHSNVQDLMLRKDVVQAIQEGKFHLWPVKTIAQGVEILTGISAGEQREDFTFPEDSVFGKADAKLKELVETMLKFAKASEEGGKEQDKPGGCADCGK